MNQSNSSDSLPNALPIIESVESATAQVSKTPDKYKFKKVKDSRGRIVEGIWIRNDRYYAQLQISGKGCRRVPLFGENRLPVENLRDAQVAYRLLLTNREAGDSPQARRGTPFAEYHKRYIALTEKLGKKHKLTIDKEKFTLRR